MKVERRATILGGAVSYLVEDVDSEARRHRSACTGSAACANSSWYLCGLATLLKLRAVSEAGQRCRNSDILRGEVDAGHLHTVPPLQVASGIAYTICRQRARAALEVGRVDGETPPRAFVADVKLIERREVVGFQEIETSAQRRKRVGNIMPGLTWE